MHQQLSWLPVLSWHSSALLAADATLLMQVQESDMHRVAVATGAQTQTTVNNLNPKVLGSVEAFEEKQVVPQPSICCGDVSPSLLHCTDVPFLLVNCCACTV